MGYLYKNISKHYIKSKTMSNPIKANSKTMISTLMSIIQFCFASLSKEIEDRIWVINIGSKENKFSLVENSLGRGKKEKQL